MNHGGRNHVPQSVNVLPEEVFDELSPFKYQGTPRNIKDKKIVEEIGK
jgi:hypothetical protein